MLIEHIIKSLDNIQYVENILYGHSFKTIPAELNEDQQIILKSLEIKLPNYL